jgi:hypothetical protein
VRQRRPLILFHQVVCSNCGLKGHKDGRSSECPKRKKKGNVAVNFSNLLDVVHVNKEVACLIEQTHTDRSKSKSERAKEVERALRQEAKMYRTKQNRNEDIEKKCSTCVAKKVYNDENAHSSRRSHKCPFHILSSEEILEEKLGKDYEIYVRRIPMASILRGNSDQKQSIIDSIDDMVSRVKQIIFKGQLFALYFMLHTLQLGKDVSAMFFTQEYFYACSQLVLGEKITSPNKKLMKVEMEEAFATYKGKYPQGLVDTDRIDGHKANYKHAIAVFASDMAKNAVNHVAENFQARAQQYFKFKIRQSCKVC